VDHEQLEENLSLYALGALDPDSSIEMEQHLSAGCPECRILLRQYQATVTELPYALPSQAPPSALKSRIMAALSGPAASTASLGVDKPASPVPIPTAPPDLATPPASSWITLNLPEESVPQRPPGRKVLGAWQEQVRAASPPLAAALGALLLGVGGYAAYLYATLEAERTATALDRAVAAKAKLEIADLKRQLEDKQAALTGATTETKRAVEALGTTHELLARNQEQIEALEAQLKTKRGPPERSRPDVAQGGTDDLVRILTSPTAKMGSLSGTVKAKEAYAMIFVEPGTRRGFFYANNLPSPPAGMTYQLWIFTDKPTSAGVFRLDSGSKGRLLMHDIPDVRRIKKFAVSLEPEGGRSKPTGSVYLVGGLS